VQAEPYPCVCGVQQVAGALQVDERPSALQALVPLHPAALVQDCPRSVIAGPQVWQAFFVVVTLQVVEVPAALQTSWPPHSPQPLPRPVTEGASHTPHSLGTFVVLQAALRPPDAQTFVPTQPFEAVQLVPRPTTSGPHEPQLLAGEKQSAPVPAELQTRWPLQPFIPVQLPPRLATSGCPQAPQLFFAGALHVVDRPSALQTRWPVQPFAPLQAEPMPERTGPPQTPHALFAGPLQV
jgi:hypothetical protein